MIETDENELLQNGENEDLPESDPGYIIDHEYNTTFNLTNLENERLYIEFCEASYTVSPDLNDNWKCIAFLEHGTYVADDVLDEETFKVNGIGDSFAGGAYYNPEKHELVFAFRGSERDLDDWKNNNFEKNEFFKIPNPPLYINSDTASVRLKNGDILFVGGQLNNKMEIYRYKH